MFSVTAILAIIALILTILSAVWRCPLWVPVLLLCIIILIQSIPLK